MKHISDSLEPNWPGEGYQKDQYQSRDAADLEHETDYQEGLIIEQTLAGETSLTLDALRKYINHECGEGDNEDFFIDMQTIIEGVLTDTFDNRHRPLNRIIAQAIRFEADKKAKEVLA